MTKPNLNGWENLICPFFASTCRRILGSYLAENGFVEETETKIGGLFFSRFGAFLEFEYELEMAPQALTIALGIGDKKYDEGGHPSAVPYWYVLPRNQGEDHSGFGRFKNVTELEALLVHFRDNFLEPYAKPLWLNLDSLESAISNFRAEFSC